MRLKTCRQCKSRFVPVRPMQVVCGPLCGLDYAKGKRAKEEKKEDRAHKERLKTIPQLKKEAQVAFNGYIRERDRQQPCISCGAPPPDLSQLHAGRDAGHLRSTGAADHLRFDERNCNAQCVSCNQYKAGNVIAYRLGLVARIGLDAVEALENDNEAVKWSRDLLREIKAIYKGKTRELLKSRS